MCRVVPSRGVAVAVADGAEPQQIEVAAVVEGAEASPEFGRDHAASSTASMRTEAVRRSQAHQAQGRVVVLQHQDLVPCVRPAEVAVPVVHGELRLEVAERI